MLLSADYGDFLAASGLYYLSEIVEEHTVIAKRFLTKMIYSVMALQLLLCLVDRFPFWPTALGVFSHFIYLGNMRRFPFVKLTDPLFIASCGMDVWLGHFGSTCSLVQGVLTLKPALVLINHYVWFRHFSHRQERAYQRMSSYYDHPHDLPTFSEIASYFGLCVWLVPFSLFVSLSASDNVLPTMGSEPPVSTSSISAGGAITVNSHKRRGQGMAKALVDSVRNGIREVGASFGWKRPEDRF